MKLLKKIGVFIAAAFMCTSLEYTVSAENSDKVVDMADLLTDSEESELESEILRIIEQHGYEYDIAAVTVNSTDGKTAEAYADDYYDGGGYGYDDEYSGVLLLIDMGDRAWHISTCGKAIDVFTDQSIDRIGSVIVPYMSDEDYPTAILAYTYCASENIDEYEYRHKPVNGEKILISLAVGVIIALIVCLIMKSQLKTAVKQFGAGNYIRRGSLNVQYSRDIFLYRTVSRRKIETDSGGHGGGSSTHVSSGGRSHGGGGGHF